MNIGLPKFFQQRMARRDQETMIARAEYVALIHRAIEQGDLGVADAQRFDRLVGQLGFDDAKLEQHLLAVQKFRELTPIADDEENRHNALAVADRARGAFLTDAHKRGSAAQGKYKAALPQSRPHAIAKQELQDEQQRQADGLKPLDAAKHAAEDALKQSQTARNELAQLREQFPDLGLGEAH